MVLKYKNYSNQDIEYLEDTEFFRCNFSMSEPLEESGEYTGHPLNVGDGDGLIFIRCNFTNRLPPPKAQLIECNTTIMQHSFVKDEESIEIDGVKIGGKKICVHRKHAVFENGEYIYYSEPIDYPTKTPKD